MLKFVMFTSRFSVYNIYFRNLNFKFLWIKEVLKEKGIKQTWLAEKLGKSYNMVSGYVQNRQQPRLEVLNEIANILDVDVRLLIESNKDSSNDS